MGRVGGGGQLMVRRKDMSVKERVGEARRQQQMRSNVGQGDFQLAYCSERFRQGLEESLEIQVETGGRRHNQAEDRGGDNKRKYKSSHRTQPIPEELVLTELTDAGPVRKENFVGRAQAAKFSDESSENEEEEGEEEYGQPSKSMRRHW